MFDNLVGKWTADGRNITGLEDYLNANQQGNKLDDYRRPITVEVSKSGQDIKIVTTPEGKEALVDDLTIGQTTKKTFPEIGEITTECRAEGSRLVAINSAPGLQVVAKYHVEGSTLVVEMSGSGKTAIMRCAKA